MVITKHSFLIMVVHNTITAIYIYNCNEVSCLHAFVVMCYLPKLKRDMLSFLINI